MTFDWSPLAIATVVLAVVAVWSILQTYSIQRTERKQRLLNEIIEWAVSLWKCQYGKDFESIVKATTADELRLAVYRHIIEFKEHFQPSMVKL